VRELPQASSLPDILKLLITNSNNHHTDTREVKERVKLTRQRRIDNLLLLYNGRDCKCEIASLDGILNLLSLNSDNSSVATRVRIIKPHIESLLIASLQQQQRKQGKRRKVKKPLIDWRQWQVEYNCQWFGGAHTNTATTTATTTATATPPLPPNTPISPTPTTRATTATTTTVTHSYPHCGCKRVTMTSFCNDFDRVYDDSNPNSNVTSAVLITRKMIYFMFGLGELSGLDGFRYDESGAQVAAEVITTNFLASVIPPLPPPAPSSSSSPSKPKLASAPAAPPISSSSSSLLPPTNDFGAIYLSDIPRFQISKYCRLEEDLDHDAISSLQS
jgi:hypothetical protein